MESDDSDHSIFVGKASCKLRLAACTYHANHGRAVYISLAVVQLLYNGTTLVQVPRRILTFAADSASSSAPCPPRLSVPSAGGWDTQFETAVRVVILTIRAMAREHERNK